MSFLLVLLAMAQPVLQSGPLLCMASMQEGQGGPIGMITLWVDPDYTPRDMRMSYFHVDAFTADLEFDPQSRALPARIRSLQYLLRYTAPPKYPLTVTTYVDGKPRWTRHVDVPFWPTIVTDQPSEAARAAGRLPGTSMLLTRADDGTMVSGARDIRAVAIDARGMQVSETRFTLPGTVAGADLAGALGGLERQYRNRECTVPPPPPD